MIPGSANLITTARAVLIVLLAALGGWPVTAGLAWSVVFIAFVAVSLDGVDGWVARRTGTVSAFGRRFDMETDAALVLVLAILAWRYGKAGPWIILSGLLRYIFVGAGWVMPWMRHPLAPSFRGRLICAVQIVALITAVAPNVQPPVSAAIAACGLAALCYSFAVDTWWLAQHAAPPRTP